MGARPMLSPVLIYGNPDDPPDRLLVLARLATASQMAPIVLHPEVMPWLRSGPALGPFAGEHARTLLGMVSRHTGGSLWVLHSAPPSAERAESWLRGVLHFWRGCSGSRDRRIRSGTWEQWATNLEAHGLQVQV